MSNDIKISNRLKTIGDFVMDNSRVVDVGCDHGLLSIYIYLNKKNIKVIASDVNEKPLNEAKKNIKEYKLDKKIETRISNGLQNIGGNEFNTIVISGLGGNTIVDILAEAKEKLNNAKHIIVQANNNIEMVRRFLVNNYYCIKDEKIVKENNIISVIILFERAEHKISYKKHELLYGPILIKNKDSLYIEYLTNDLKKYKTILSKIPKKYFCKKIRLNRQIKIIDNLLRK